MPPFRCRTAPWAPALALALAGGLASRPARAGDGPWTLSSGDHSIYAGGDWSRWTRYEADGDADRDMGMGVSRGGFLGVWSVGLREGVEVEVQLPVHTVRVDAPGAGACAAPPARDWCADTTGLGRISARAKFRLVDEVFRPPLTLSLVLGAETGEHNAHLRGRLTNLGEGQSDAFGGLSTGRAAPLGPDGGWYRAHLTALYALRAPLEGEGAAARPGDELRGSLAAMVSPRGRLGLGLELGGHHRLAGEALADIPLGAPNAWAQLQTSQLRAGAKLMVAGDAGRPSLTLGWGRAVWARNAPSDETFVSFGLGWFLSAVAEDPFLAAP